MDKGTISTAGTLLLSAQGPPLPYFSTSLLSLLSLLSRSWQVRESVPSTLGGRSWNEVSQHATFQPALSRCVASVLECLGCVTRGQDTCLLTLTCRYCLVLDIGSCSVRCWATHGHVALGRRLLGQIHLPRYMYLSTSLRTYLSSPSTPRPGRDGGEKRSRH
jgi:hypothetical protein